MIIYGIRMLGGLFIINIVLSFNSDAKVFFGLQDFDYNSKLILIQDNNSQPRAALPASIEQQNFICRAAIAGMMGRPIEIIRAVTDETGLTRTEYSRPTDGSLWRNACKLEGSRVVWASVEGGRVGRWRTHPADEIVSYKLDEKGVTIVQRFADGSALSDRFAFDVPKPAILETEAPGFRRPSTLAPTTPPAESIPQDVNFANCEKDSNGDLKEPGRVRFFAKRGVWDC